LLTYGVPDHPLAFPSTQSESTLAENSITEIKLPLLVWIDDNPINNIYEASYARELGINVIQLTSTALAKAWIKENSGQ
jgi:single-stranded DNA-specific DHH superfamily exonuclease